LFLTFQLNGDQLLELSDDEKMRGAGMDYVSPKKGFPLTGLARSVLGKDDLYALAQMKPDWSFVNLEFDLTPDSLFEITNNKRFQMDRTDCFDAMERYVAHVAQQRESQDAFGKVADIIRQVEANREALQSKRIVKQSKRTPPKNKKEPKKDGFLKRLFGRPKP